ncbi:MarR family transcriptional regulator [Clostridium swellfunianum]|uniref:MarR family winged helix-turn-helix transcriptional regulator n=1 Tax=Clostridium swellfunianum TaxID=1367462 RepID=UPI00202ED5EA|nr:MarR family transcriptional regulator [Clostridium swellfunianum]MCM0650018.1 MarR family transcriptional regulator [Clostridium swellfunianum]
MDKYDKIKLNNQICFPLYALSREVIKLYQPILSKYNLTYTQYIAMLVMWEEEKINFKQLGQRLHLDSGTLTPLLKKLESMDLIVKYRNKDDDRVVTVELTERGKLLRDEILEVPDAVYCNFKGSEQKLLMLKKQLDELLSTMEDK